MRGRRVARRTGRRTARRTTRRRMVVAGPARRRSRRMYRRSRRRFRRRRILFGGAVLLAAGGAAYAGVKLAQKDADHIEEYTGVPVEELSDEELQGAMDDLGVQSMELDEQDYAALSAEPDAAPAEAPAAQPAYLEELEQLAALRDQGIISDEEFEAKKGQLLGL
ncbi:MAG TPA: SHOCT domain-containing protein [Anaerolineae bacterium]|nr:SHOCT domain-containing protein [Anaerolineae bacterium]